MDCVNFVTGLSNVPYTDVVKLRGERAQARIRRTVSLRITFFSVYMVNKFFSITFVLPLN